MDTLVGEALERYALAHSQAPPELLDRLEQETREATTAAQMLTGRTEGQFLRLLATLVGARKILEVGMFTGYSALMMADALPPEGELHTCEISPAYAEIARRYFGQSPHGDKIRIHMGPALETLKELRGPFDLAFVDADKENYPNYYEPVLELLRPGGLVVFDNVLWSGRILDPQDEASRAIHELNERVHEDPRVEHVLLTIRDGVLIGRKLAR
jgi:caffeoyl-CoA O-methyltransferase